MNTPRLWFDAACNPKYHLSFCIFNILFTAILLLLLLFLLQCRGAETHKFHLFIPIYRDVRVKESESMGLQTRFDLRGLIAV